MAAAAIPLGMKIAPLVGGLLGGLLGRSSGAKKSAEEKTGINQLIGAGDTGFKTAEGLQPYATNFLQKGTDTFAPSVDYWSRILSGDRGEIMNAVGPEVGRIAAGYQSAARQVGQFAPMGGGRSTLLAELPFQQNRDISSLIAGLRPQAAEKLSGIAAQLANLGLDAEQIIGALLQGIRSGGSELANIGMKSRGITAASTLAGAQGGAEIGRSIYDMIKG